MDFTKSDIGYFAGFYDLKMKLAMGEPHDTCGKILFALFEKPYPTRNSFQVGCFNWSLSHLHRR
jgi:hypothetical protein